MPVPTNLIYIKELLWEAAKYLKEIEDDFDNGKPIDEAKAGIVKENLRKAVRAKYEILAEFPTVGRLTFSEFYRTLEFIDELISRSANIVLFAPDKGDGRRELARKLLTITLREVEFLESQLPSSPGSSPKGFASLRNVIEAILRVLEDPITHENCVETVRQLDGLSFLILMGAGEVEFEYYGKRMDFWYEEWHSLDAYIHPSIIDSMLEFTQIGETREHIKIELGITRGFIEIARMVKDRLMEVMRE